MAPRCSKKSCKVRNPIPVWLPVPRPCLRSLNVPGPPCYMQPEMFIPPWALPPSYFTRPRCHCANENFCTASNCKKSADCLKTHPIFCPHGTDDEETSGLPRNVRDQDQSDGQESSSNSDINICSACGAPSNGRMLSKKSNLNQDNLQSYHASKVSQTQELPQNLTHNQSLEDIDRPGKNTRISERNTSSPPPHEIACCNKPCCTNSSCQTNFSNSRSQNNIKPKTSSCCRPITNCRSSDSTADYADDSETSFNTKVSNNGTMNNLGRRSCTEQDTSVVNEVERMANSLSNAMYKKETIGNAQKNEVGCSICSENMLETNKKLTVDSIHLDQLPDNLSNARKKQASKYSECRVSEREINSKTDNGTGVISKSFTEKPACCITGSDSSKTGNEIPISNPIKERPLNDVTKFRKKSDCECTSSKTSVKAPSKSHKYSQCICSAKPQLKGSSRSRKRSKSPPKAPQKIIYKSNKMSECCSPSKLHQRTSFGKVSECSCSFSRSRRVTETGITHTQRSVPCTNSSNLMAKRSNKSVKDSTSLIETDIKQSGCQCKFPPSYQHLSCSGNPSAKCSCSNRGCKQNKVSQ